MQNLLCLGEAAGASNQTDRGWFIASVQRTQLSIAAAVQTKDSKLGDLRAAGDKFTPVNISVWLSPESSGVSSDRLRRARAEAVQW